MMNKEERKEYAKYPQCPNCENAMVFTFSFPGEEYACLPCNETDEFFPRGERIWRSIKHMSAKKRKWSEELSIIARRIGGGQCAIKVCKNESCDHCKRAADPNYKFIYWKKKQV